MDRTGRGSRAFVRKATMTRMMSMAIPATVTPVAIWEVWSLLEYPRSTAFCAIPTMTAAGVVDLEGETDTCAGITKVVFSSVFQGMGA